MTVTTVPVRTSKRSSERRIKTVPRYLHLGDAALEGKKDAIMMTRAVLDCNMEPLPEYGFNDIWDHGAAALPVDEQG